MAKKYDKDFGMGSLISMMLPYSIAFLLVWIIQLIVWVVLLRKQRIGSVRGIGPFFFLVMELSPCLLLIPYFFQRAVSLLCPFPARCSMGAAVFL